MQQATKEKTEEQNLMDDFSVIAYLFFDDNQKLCAADGICSEQLKIFLLSYQKSP